MDWDQLGVCEEYRMGTNGVAEPGMFPVMLLPRGSVESPRKGTPRAEQLPGLTVATGGWHGRDYSVASLFGLLALCSQPLIKLLPQLLSQIEEAQAGATGVIHPRNLHFGFQGAPASR